MQTDRWPYLIFNAKHTVYINKYYKNNCKNLRRWKWFVHIEKAMVDCGMEYLYLKIISRMAVFGSIVLSVWIIRITSGFIHL